MIFLSIDLKIVCLRDCLALQSISSIFASDQPNVCGASTLKIGDPAYDFKLIKRFFIPTTYIYGKVAEWSKASDLSLVLYILLCILLVNPRSRKRQGFEPLPCHFFFFLLFLFSSTTVFHTNHTDCFLFTPDCPVFSSSFYPAWERLLGAC